jgi:NTE family protein
MKTHGDYENLVFEGGGVCGFAYCGAISELDNKGILPKIKRFAGTSFGAIFASLLAADFTAKEILEFKNVLNFNGLSYNCDLSDIFKLMKNHGVNSSSKIRKQIETFLSTRVSPDETLSGLFKKTGKDLVIVSCCLNREKPVYFHHSTYGDVKLIDAIIASISIPIFFQPLKLSLFGEEDYFVDGGIVDNYPIWIFNDINALYKNDLTSIDRKNVNPLTIGLKLIGCGEKKDRTSVIDVFNVFTLFITTLTSRIDSDNYSPKSVEQTINISTDSIYFLDFNINKDQISQLIENGANGVRKYFKNTE